MAHDILGLFLDRYPSALGVSHAGGQYRIICPNCGNIVAVPMLDEAQKDLHVHCDDCGYDDRITGKGVASAA
jgi:DNA-directed RNA polymerase subunit RPC12/RpoP